MVDTISRCFYVVSLCSVLVHSVELNGFGIGGFSKLDEKSILSIEEKVREAEKQLPALDRHKRQLLFPIATLVQISFCMATQVQLKVHPFFVNQGFQLNFFTPFRLNQLPNSFLGTPPVIDAARSRTRRDDGNSTEVHAVKEKDDEFTSEHMYYVIESLLDSLGYNGSDCLLHTICQLAKIPLQQEEDLFHEIIQFIMTPSVHDMPNKTDAVNDADPTAKKYVNKEIKPFETYLKAELYGRIDGDCDVKYQHCPSSPLDLISQVEYVDDNEV